jgi:hypothetical protein
MCERLCNLISWQHHCIKNDKFLICAVIEHIFVQVVPMPKPRGTEMTAAEQHVAGRATRRAEARQQKEQGKADEKKRRLQVLKEKDEARTPKPAIKDKPSRSNGPQVTPTRAEKGLCFGEELNPDLEVGKRFVEDATKSECIWDEPITYELQVRGKFRQGSVIVKNGNDSFVLLGRVAAGSTTYF